MLGLAASRPEKPRSWQEAPEDCSSLGPLKTAQVFRGLGYGYGSGSLLRLPVGKAAVVEAAVL